MYRVRARAHGQDGPSTAGARQTEVGGIHRIEHVIVIMQENRSFDHYFGTFPGADGLPRDAQGQFTVCNPNPDAGTCDEPFHDPNDVNFGGPHDARSFVRAVDGGRLDGFISVAQALRPCT